LILIGPPLAGRRRCPRQGQEAATGRSEERAAAGRIPVAAGRKASEHVSALADRGRRCRPRL